jgi:hypothetical protein
MYRGGGSIAFIGAARAGLLAAADPDDETGRRRVIAVVKSNLAETPDSLAYALGNNRELGCGVIEWQGASSHSADDLLRAPQSDEERSALDEAKDFLLAELGEGAVLAADVTKTARSHGISERTLARAKASLGVVSDKPSYQSGWYWSLLEEGCQAPEGQGDEKPVGTLPQAPQKPVKTGDSECPTPQLTPKAAKTKRWQPSGTTSRHGSFLEGATRGMTGDECWAVIRDQRVAADQDAE